MTMTNEDFHGDLFYNLQTTLVGLIGVLCAQHPSSASLKKARRVVGEAHHNFETFPYKQKPDDANELVRALGAHLDTQDYMAMQVQGVIGLVRFAERLGPFNAYK